MEANQSESQSRARHRLGVPGGNCDFAEPETAGQEHLHVVSVPQGTVYLALAIRAGLTIAAGLLILSVAGH